MKTFKLYTLGCKVNQYESQLIREGLAAFGYREASRRQRSPAVVCVINTCTVTHRADADSLSMIRRAKQENPAARIVVTGCLAELDKNKIASLGVSSLIIGNKGKAMIARFLNGKKQEAGSAGITGIKGISDFSGHTRAFLKIQDGCDNFCSYCKVPLVRGRSKSRQLQEIVAEAGRLVKRGFKEIVLTGICLGAYGKDLSPRLALADVIEALGDLDGLARLRLSSIEAGDVSTGLLKLIAASRVVCPHLHIPLQSGDNRVLCLMNRKYTAGQYLAVIKKAKQYIPGLSITTDILVGFPGETEAGFRNTLRLVKKIQPLKVHIFPYSPRQGTAAGDNPAAVLPPQVVKERMRQLQDVARACGISYEDSLIGKQQIVLWEGRCKDDPHCWEGHTGNYIKVRVRSGKYLKNRLARVTLKRGVLDFIYAGKMKLLTK